MYNLGFRQAWKILTNFHKFILNSFHCLIQLEPPRGWLCETVHTSPFRISVRLRITGSFYLVGLSGLEPPTSRLSGVRSNQLSSKPINGGDEGIRTPDPLLAGQVLSQLSYTPIFGFRFLYFSTGSEN